jgi:twitching motility protein PilT
VAKIDALFKMMNQYDASDLHMSAGNPPILRINGRLQRTKSQDLSSREIEMLLLEILDEESLAIFKERKDVNFSYELEGVARFRANVFLERKGYGAAFRIIPTKIKTLEELGLPESITGLVRSQNGLLMVTGPNGSGKSTTIAAIIDLMNREQNYHIITLEDPIEFIQQKGKSLIHQRQLGLHLKSMASGLRAALREDPDVILVGEMVDPETVLLALTAAESNLLVIGTLYTSNAGDTVDRLIDVFPTFQQPQIRSMVSVALHGVISQRLLRRADGHGRVAALEVMVKNAAVKNLISEGKSYQIFYVIQSGMNEGMQTMEGSINGLVKQGLVNQEEASLFLQDGK